MRLSSKRCSLRIYEFFSEPMTRLCTRQQLKISKREVGRKKVQSIGAECALYMLYSLLVFFTVDVNGITQVLGQVILF